MKSLVVGYGSIGSRHARLLGECGCSVAIVSSREINHENRYTTIEKALEVIQPDYVVVANKTNEHYKSLVELAENNFRGIVLVEKPLFDKVRDIPSNNFKKIFVAYNLRFHPLIQKLYEILKTEKIISAHAYVGQYLPNWRPDKDYKESYSAKKSFGGGVLRDLSHELDYINWLFGSWKSLVAIGGKYSHLEIDSDDLFSVIMTSSKCPVITLQLNYLDRLTRRELLVNTDKHTIKADFINCTLTVDEQVERIPIERDFTYRAQHQAIMNETLDYVCSARNGMEVMKMIKVIEQSAKKREWCYSNE